MYRRIRELREDRDLTQKQVAQMLGMSQTGYSKYETGENDVPTQVLLKLADFYDTTVDYLLGAEPKAQAIVKGPACCRAFLFNLLPPGRPAGRPGVPA